MRIQAWIAPPTVASLTRSCSDCIIHIANPLGLCRKACYLSAGLFLPVSQYWQNARGGLLFNCYLLPAGSASRPPAGLFFAANRRGGHAH